MRPDQLGDFRQPSDPCLHPDGKQVAFTVTQMDLEADEYVRRIWLWDGRTARPLTAGPSDAHARWSPDGETLAFLRKASDDKAKPQLALLPTSGGEAETITEFDLGVSEIAWAPDGSRVAVVAAEWHGEWADLEDDERARKPRRIDHLAYRGDNRGWVHDRRSHVWLVDPAGGDPQCLTPGDFDESAIAWHPEGDRLVFRSARHDPRRVDPGSQIWEIGIEGGEAKPLLEVGGWDRPTYDRAGNLHVLGLEDAFDWPAAIALWRVDDGAARNLTAGLDRSFETASPPTQPAGPQWLEDGSGLSIVEDSGRIRVVRITTDGEILDVIGGDRVVSGFSARSDGTAMVFIARTPTGPGELYWWEGGEERRLTDLNGEFSSVADLAEPQRFTFDMDGEEIEGWVYLPRGDDLVPLLLNIHGGPAAQYGYGFFDEFQVYTGAGYGVVAINPRGSSGYGTDHVRAVVGAWQTDEPPDIADFERAVEVALEKFPRLDGERRGVMGGSYGGLATVRFLSRNQSYRSAVAERGLYTWASFAGTSDIGAFFDKMYIGEQLPGGHEALRRASSLTYAHRVTTPTLIVHSEHDFRTPIEQGEQLFALLMRLGVETEMVRFPDESHELSRSGKPKHRVERFEAILDWHDRHLK